MVTKKFRNAIGYTTSGIRDSLDRQHGEILLEAYKNGFHIIDWFCDDVGDTEKPELNRILSKKKITDEPYEAVFVYSAGDTVSDINYYFYYLYLLEKRNVKLISLYGFNDVKEYTIPLVLKAFALFVAEQEREKIANSKKISSDVKAAAGGFCGGRPPFGYKTKNVKLIVIPEEAEIVKLIFEKRKTMNMMQIAKWLNDNGFKTRTGKEFRQNSISAILKNEPLYRGMYRYGKSNLWVPGIHEPILTD